MQRTRTLVPVAGVAFVVYGVVRRIFNGPPDPSNAVRNLLVDRANGAIAMGCILLAIGLGPRAWRSLRQRWPAAVRHPLTWLTVVSAVARLACIRRSEVDFDETASWFYGEMIADGRGFWNTLTLGIDAPLYPALNWPFTQFSGNTIAVLRLPSALFGIGSVLVFYDLVRRLHSQRVAFVAALMAALSPFLVYYSQNARPYAQMGFFCLLFTWAFFVTESWRHPVWRALVLAVLSCLAIASQYYALVYLAAFYAVVGVHHLGARRFREFRREFWTGVAGLVCAIPLIWLCVGAVGRLSLKHWEPLDLNLAMLSVEQFLFTGTVGTQVDQGFRFLCTGLFVVLVFPLALVALRRIRLPQAHPVLTSMWIVAPLLVAATDVFLSGKHLFFPRGFIGSTPFLFSYLAILWVDTPLRTWVKRAYATVVLVPYAAASWMVISNDPSHVAIAHRAVMPVIAQRVRQLGAGSDFVLVHHYWTSVYLMYFLGGDRHRVIALGLYERALAVQQGELAAIRASLGSIPDGPLLAVINSIATQHVDPRGEVVHELAATRPLLGRESCHPRYQPGMALLCEQILLFGRKTHAARDAPARDPAP